MRFWKIKILALCLLLLFTAGCGDKMDKKQEPSKAQIQAGGKLVYGSLQEPNTLNPYFSDLIATAEVGSLIFSGLITMNDKGEWTPDLASAVPSVSNGGISPDGLTITYHLRPGVSWHDGASFTSEDVKFTWEFIMNRRANVVSREGYNKIASIDTPNPQTVVVRFREYYAPALTLFPVVLPKHLLGAAEDPNKAAFNRNPVGTGPFRFKEWRLAEAIVVEANPNYYRGKPKLDSIVYKIMPETNILLTQLKNGEVDIISNVNFSQLEQVKAIDHVRTLITPNMVWEHMDFNLDNELFQDIRVRQAIGLAIDRQSIVNSALKNAASPAVGDQPPITWAYNPALKPAPRNVNGAKDLLNQAGWKQGTDGIYAKNGRRLSFELLTTANNKIRENVAQIIAQQLKEIGVEVLVHPIEPTAFFGDVLKNRRFEAAMYAWVAGPDPDNFTLWNSKNIPGRSNGYEGQNYPGWRNPEVDKLTGQAATTVDVEARKQLYFRIQEMLLQDCPVISLYCRANIDAVRNTVVNYKPNPTPSGNLWNAWEWALTAKE